MVTSVMMHVMTTLSMTMPMLVMTTIATVRVAYDDDVSYDATMR